MALCGCRRRSHAEKQRNEQTGCRKSCSSLHNPTPPLVGAEDRCSRIGNHSEAIHALIRRIDSIRKDARLVTAKAESGPLEIREPLRPWAPALYPTAPVRRIADYARVRIQPLRVLLRPKPMLSAHLFNFAKRSSGTRLAGVTGCG